MEVIHLQGLNNMLTNNKQFEDYDEHIEHTQLLYVDANNLYGKAMCEYLPYSGIKLNNDILIDDDLNTTYESYIGYMV